ncbi:MAG: ABC transporter permease, partial [Myxococcota bacterium]
DALRRGISGGQRKRVNLGQELMTRSTRMLFLDEPTSGLDPRASQDIVRLVRQLADRGRIIFLVTHDLTPEVMAQVDHLLVLAKGGRVAFFGPPDEASRWFGVSTPDAIFNRFADHAPEEWGQMYKDGDAFRKYVTTRQHLVGVRDPDETFEAKPDSTVKQVSGISQTFTMTARYLRVKLRDRTGMFVIALQPPFLVLVMAILFPSPTEKMLFMLSLSALWFGLSAAVRELISDRVIFRRERRVGVGVVPYLASKVIVLAGLTGIQALVLSSAIFVILGMGGEYGFSLQLLALSSVLTAWVGMATGLLISASWNSSEAAVGTLPLLLIPQIAFSSVLLPIKDMTLLGKACTWITFQRYTFDAAIKCGEQIARATRTGDYEPQPINGTLYDLGLKFSSRADDYGLSLPMLLFILSAIIVFMLVITRIRLEQHEH